MPALHGVAMNGGARDAAHKDGHAFHAGAGFGRPGNRRFGANIDLRHVGAAAHQHVAGHLLKQRMAVAADVHILGAVDADTAQHQQPGPLAACPLKDFVPGFAIHQRDLEVDALFGGDGLRDLQVRFIDFRQAGIDDLFVQLLLFFEAEDLRRLLREHVYDAVEDGIVQIGVVDGNRLDGAVEGAAQFESDFQAAEGLRAAVDGDGYRSVALLAEGARVFDDQGVGADAAQHALADAADLAFFHRAHAQRAHDHEIIAAFLDVFDQFLPVLPVEDIEESRYD